MQIQECPLCLQAITFMQPLRREEKLACPYCKAALCSKYVPRDSSYGPHFVIVPQGATGARKA